jgi:hypothetical protein
MAVTSAIVAGVGVGSNVYYARKQGKLQQRQIDEQRKAADLESIRNRAESVRRARAARASIVNSGGVGGTGGSSGVAGGTASVGSQLSSNLGYINQSTAIQNNLFNISAKSAKMQTQQSIFNSVLSVAQTGASVASGVGYTPGVDKARSMFTPEDPAKKLKYHAGSL